MTPWQKLSHFEKAEAVRQGLLAGLRQVDIAKQYGASRGAISETMHRLELTSKNAATWVWPITRRRGRAKVAKEEAHPIVKELTKIQSEQRISDRAMNELLGCGDNTLHAYRTNRFSPSLHIITKWANVLGYDLDLFLKDNKDDNP